jgi:hypothetical protein
MDSLYRTRHTSTYGTPINFKSFLQSSAWSFVTLTKRLENFSTFSASPENQRMSKDFFRS